MTPLLSAEAISKFYGARAAITQRLIEDHGFTIVAAEADWPDAAQVRLPGRLPVRRHAQRHGALRDL